MPKKLLIFPFGGNARESLLSVLALNQAQREWDVVGFLDDDPLLRGRDYLGIKVLGGREVLEIHPDAFVLAVPGSPKGYLGRAAIIEGLPVDESRFATIVHPSVVKAPDAQVGRNTLLMPNVVISCGVRVGSHCVVLPNTVVAHDSVVEDFCCIGSNVSISGGVTIGRGCYIGSGARIREDLRIGERSLIGLGSNVIADVEGGVVAVGNPARVLRRIALEVG
ncbi:MAG: dTDP-4-amino-4,6-dideoxy-D-glucose acetyltransferase VioB [Thermodesulfovibrionales bacterium]